VDKLKETSGSESGHRRDHLQALPEGLHHVGHLGGVWVADFASAVGGHILRAKPDPVAVARASVVARMKMGDAL